MFCACGVPASEVSGTDNADIYYLDFKLRPEPSAGLINVELVLNQSRGQLRQIAFSTSGVQNLTGTDEIILGDDEVIWRPSQEGGSLQWSVDIAHRRNQNGYDALLDPNWGIFRAEDVIPRARTRALKGTRSKSRLIFDLPKSWSAITEYPLVGELFEIDKQGRNYDEPSGWIAIGELGVRREIIAGTRVAIAAPIGHSTRRMDMLALLNWTLPELAQITGETLPRLTLVSAMDPMWRGGLSAPASIYLHADRPLISENATSTLIHEVMHVVLSLDVDDDSDWITEGLAEYYSLELLRRSGAITARRYEVAMAHQSERAKKAATLCGSRSTGATTSLAVTLFAQLDAEIRLDSAGDLSLDSIVPELIAADSALNAMTLRRIVQQKTGQMPDVLHSKGLPGCSTL